MRVRRQRLTIYSIAAVGRTPHFCINSFALSSLLFSLHPLISPLKPIQQGKTSTAVRGNLGRPSRHSESLSCHRFSLYLAFLPINLLSFSFITTSKFFPSSINFPAQSLPKTANVLCRNSANFDDAGIADHEQYCGTTCGCRREVSRFEECLATTFRGAAYFPYLEVVGFWPLE